MYNAPEKAAFFVTSVFLPPLFVWLVTMVLQVAALSVFTSCLTVMFTFFVCLYCWIIIKAIRVSSSLIATPKALAVTTASVLSLIWVLSYLNDLEIKNYYFLSLSIIFCSMLLVAYFVLEKIAKVSLMCLVGSEEGQKEKLFYLLSGLGVLFAAFSFLEFNSYDASFHIVLNVYTITVGIVTAYIFGSYYLTNEQKQALESAVKNAPQMIFARRLQGRADKRDLYYSDRQYFNAWGGGDADWYQPSYLDFDQRATYFQVAYSSAPAMVVDTINLGSKYPTTLRDKDGNLLEGSHNYKLHLPANIPVKLYWAITMYNPADGTMPQTNQAFPSINQFNKPIYNQDGSLDIYFGPNKPTGIDEKNWIQTLPNKAFLVTIRLYGTKAAFFNQSWKPDDIIKIN